MPMADLIDRDALLKDLRSECPESDVCISSVACIDCIVNRQPSVNLWILVEDALPENNEIVWVCLYFGKEAYVRKGYIKNEVWYTADGYRMCITLNFGCMSICPNRQRRMKHDR